MTRHPRPLVIVLAECGASSSAAFAAWPPPWLPLRGALDGQPAFGLRGVALRLLRWCDDRVALFGRAA